MAGGRAWGGPRSAGLCTGPRAQSGGREVPGGPASSLPPAQTRGLRSERLFALKRPRAALPGRRPCSAVRPPAGSPLGDSVGPCCPWAAFSLGGRPPCGLLWPLEKLHPDFPCRGPCARRPGPRPPDVLTQAPWASPCQARHAAEATRSPQLPGERGTACPPAPRGHGLRAREAPSSPTSGAGLAWKVPVAQAASMSASSSQPSWGGVAVPLVRAGPGRARARTRIPTGRPAVGGSRLGSGPAPGPPFVAQPLAVRPPEDGVRCRVVPGRLPHCPGHVAPAAPAEQTSGATGASHGCPYVRGWGWGRGRPRHWWWC